MKTKSVDEILTEYQTAINQIDDYFEYAFKAVGQEENKKYVMDTINQLTNRLKAEKTKHTDSYNKVADAMQIIETQLKEGAFTSSEVHAINAMAGVVGRATGKVLKAMIKEAEKN